MAALVALLVPLIILVIIALVIVWVAERFSPDPLITKIVYVVVFGIVLVALIVKLLPLLKL